jgi:ATP-binding cassette subfamily B protein
MRGDPLLLLFDEPTASMDPEAEHQLFEQFIRIAAENANRSGTITLLVTHRYSTVRDADLVIVLDDGQIVERGRHEELMALGGRYAHLYSLQANGYR